MEHAPGCPKLLAWDVPDACTCGGVTLRERNLYGENVHECAVRMSRQGRANAARQAEHAARYFAARLAGSLPYQASQNRPDETGLPEFYLRVAALLQEEP